MKLLKCRKQIEDQKNIGTKNLVTIVTSPSKKTKIHYTEVIQYILVCLGYFINSESIIIIHNCMHEETQILKLVKGTAGILVPRVDYRWILKVHYICFCGSNKKTNYFFNFVLALVFK